MVPKTLIRALEINGFFFRERYKGYPIFEANSSKARNKFLDSLLQQVVDFNVKDLTEFVIPAVRQVGCWCFNSTWSLLIELKKPVKSKYKRAKRICMN